MKTLTKLVLIFIVMLNIVACTSAERFKLSIFTIEAQADSNSSLTKS
jgi:hypothetical protein